MLRMACKFSLSQILPVNSLNFDFFCRFVQFVDGFACTLSFRIGYVCRCFKRFRISKYVICLDSSCYIYIQSLARCIVSSSSSSPAAKNRCVAFPLIIVKSANNQAPP